MAELPDQVFAVGYRRLEAGRPAWPPWAIARTLLTLAWRKRGTKFVLLACLGVVFAHGAWIVFQMLFRRFAPSEGALNVEFLVGTTQEALASYFTWQFYVSAIAVAIIGAGAVAEDTRAGAFELYFARPLTRAQYALGKLIGVGLVPFSTVFLAGSLLWLTAVGIAPTENSEGLWDLALPTVALGLLGAAVLTATIVGLSSVGGKARTVGVAYVVGLLMLSALATGLVAAGYQSAGYLSPERNMHTVAVWLLNVDAASVGGQFVARQSRFTNPSAAASLFALFGFIGAGWGLLWWRIRTAVAG